MHVAWAEEAVRSSSPCASTHHDSSSSALLQLQLLCKLRFSRNAASGAAVTAAAAQLLRFSVRITSAGSLRATPAANSLEPLWLLVSMDRFS